MSLPACASPRRPNQTASAHSARSASPTGRRNAPNAATCAGSTAEMPPPGLAGGCQARSLTNSTIRVFPTSAQPSPRETLSAVPLMPAARSKVFAVVDRLPDTRTGQRTDTTTPSSRGRFLSLCWLKQLGLHFGEPWGLEVMVLSELSADCFHEIRVRSSACQSASVRGANCVRFGFHLPQWGPDGGPAVGAERAGPDGSSAGSC
jgi:hypothetical protein